MIADLAALLAISSGTLYSRLPIRNPEKLYVQVLLWPVGSVVCRDVYSHQVPWESCFYAWTWLKFGLLIVIAGRLCSRWIATRAQVIAGRGAVFVACACPLFLTLQLKDGVYTWLPDWSPATVVWLSIANTLILLALWRFGSSPGRIFYSLAFWLFWAWIDLRLTGRGFVTFLRPDLQSVLSAIPFTSVPLLSFLLYAVALDYRPAASVERPS
jgi:hypothetical protein